MKRGLLCVALIFLSLMAGCIIVPLPLPLSDGTTLPAVTPTPTSSTTPAVSPTPAAAQFATPTPVRAP
jgi:hypothetical protein